VGCCGLAPVVTVDAKLLAKVTDEMLETHLGDPAATAVGAPRGGAAGPIARDAADGEA
jgi:hypothetical protein